MSKVLLSFSAPAQFEWDKIFNNIELSIRPGGEFCEARDYASKVAENIARLAGVFHAFEGYEGTKISVETLMSAANVVMWYAQEFVRLFSPPDPLHETIKDAYDLEYWLVRLVAARGWDCVHKTFVMQRGPNRLRNKDRLDWAVNCLVAGGRISIFWQGKKQFFHLNPAFFGPAVQGLQPVGFLPLG